MKFQRIIIEERGAEGEPLRAKQDASFFAPLKNYYKDFFSSSDNLYHAENSSGRQGDARYVIEYELAPKVAPVMLNELCSFGGQHFLTRPVADHIDMRSHSVTNHEPAAEVFDAVNLAQLRAGRCM